MSKWKPIGTAPTKDWVLVYEPEPRAGEPVMSVDIIGDWSIVRFRNVGPTHWMPLPEPPEVEK